MCKWKKLHKYTYWQIYDQFKDKFVVFATLTDMDGQYGRPTIMTQWGFKNSDYPLIKSYQTKEYNHKDHRFNKDWDVEYYIISEAKKEDN